VKTWSCKHRSWLTSVRFADHASRATVADYLHAHDVPIARRDQVEADLAELALTVPCAHTVARLRCLRGIDTLSAPTTVFSQRSIRRFSAWPRGPTLDGQQASISCTAPPMKGSFTRHLLQRS
jgi:hypothetical protein